MTKLWPVMLLLSMLLVAEAQAQGTKADYERMKQLRERTADNVFRIKVQPNWLPGNNHFWYRVQTAADSFEFVFVDADKGTREEAFNHQRVAELLSEKLNRPVNPNQLPFQQIGYSADRSLIHFIVEGTSWTWHRSDESLTPAEKSIELPGDDLELPASETKGGDTNILFVNRTQQYVQLIWIDSAGNFSHYRDVAPGKNYTEHSYVGHVWLVATFNGQALAVYEAKAGQNRVNITGDNPRPLSQRQIQKLERPLEEVRKRRAVERKQQVWQTSVQDHNLLIRNRKTKEARQLTFDGNENHFLSDRCFLSPDERFLVAQQIRPGQNRQIPLIESSPDDQLQPKLHHLDYAKPGDELKQIRLRLFDLESGSEIPVDGSLFQNQWSLSEFDWDQTGEEFRFLFNQRGHQMLRYLGIDTAGQVRTIIEEKSPTFIDYTRKFFLKTIPETDEIIWMSERGGWNHLYLYDAKTGEVKNQITTGEWVVRKVLRVDVGKREIWFQASGIDPEQDPYYLHECRINFEGTNLVRLTEGDGTHQLEYSPDRRYFVDRFSRVDLPDCHQLRKTEDGTLVCELEQGDWNPLLETGWKPAERLVAKGRDGVTDIHGLIYFPTNYDSEKSYPVVEYIYAGPHDSFVPKEFSVHNPRRELAELGFIVVRIDGMGTSNRSKAFHDVCWKNLGDAGFPDRILWMQAAAKKHPSMDLNRIGIYGGSAGGQSSTRALLAFGDFYKVAVSDCGCHDNRVDKIWWNEQWMGWPIGPHYAQQANATNAHQLQGKLFLIVGELDRNVDPASTMQVVDALIKSDKDFDLLVVPGGGHGIGSRPYGLRRTRDFFVRHLLGVEPRS